MSSIETRTGGPVPFFGLTPDLRALQAEVRDFSSSRLRERARDLEWSANPRDRVAWDLLEEVSTRGWRTMGLPAEAGGRGASALELAVLIEELAYGDMGFAVLIDQCLKVERIVYALSSGAARQRFLDRFLGNPRCLLSICFTEPETGSDYIIDHRQFRFQTNAELRSDGNWVLNGLKHFISNAPDAEVFCVFACTDPDRPAGAGTSAFLVFADDPGFEVVHVHEKMSQRGNNNGRIRFNDVVLTPDRLLGEAHSGYAGSRYILKESAITAGATTLGTARAAYELALEHARTRVQGGVPIYQHANVGCRLAEMYCELEAARSLIWRAAWAVENDPDYDFRMSSAAKVHAADVAMRTCLSAAEIFGGLAVMYRDSDINKFVRDCMSFLHSDGAQDSHRLRIAAITEEMAGLGSGSAARLAR
ncbi:MAG TPA: acyl-CoA dehydrogenase family protein [Candidatus Acidoferrales bacterium]|nr:acyl-CoA dehydrogenase family protein [Candidatus Acidoferrales bacterium]